MRGEEHVKKINWHDSYNFFIKGVKGSWQSRMSKGDKFYKLFLGDVTTQSFLSAQLSSKVKVF